MKKVKFHLIADFTLPLEESMNKEQRAYFEKAKKEYEGQKEEEFAKRTDDANPLFLTEISNSSTIVEKTLQEKGYKKEWTKNSFLCRTPNLEVSFTWEYK